MSPEAEIADALAPYVRACPGPPLAVRGLTLCAYQPIPDIGVGSAVSSGSAPSGGSRASGGSGAPGGAGAVRAPDAPAAARAPGGSVHYLRSVAEVAAAMRCGAAPLSRAARRHGYSFSRAVRWVTFVHGVGLRRGGDSWERVAWRLRFSDAAGWTRFTTRLVGRTAAQLPHAPLDFWVWEAIRDVFLERADAPRSPHRPSRNDKHTSRHDNARVVASGLRSVREGA